MVQYIKLDDIRPNPVQIRKRFTKRFAKTLRGSLKEHGLVVPLSVIKKNNYYEIETGEQRWRELKALGVEKLEVGQEVIIKADDSTALLRTFLENRVRKEFHPVEEALGLLRLLKQKYGDHSANDFIRRI